MKALKPSTTRQLNNLIEFRQKVYEQILVGAGDAQFELIDALLLSEQLRCFAQLSLSPAFRRRWPSAYNAIDDGEQSSYWLSQCFEQQVPRQGVQVFPLDTTVWPHPSARTLSGLVYAPSPTKALKKQSIVQGHLYSMLTWTPEPGRSWSPTLSTRRIKPEQTAIEVGVSQVKQMCRQRLDPLKRWLDVIVADGHYGNHLFFGPLQGLGCAALARLRCDRVLYGQPAPYAGRGRPAVHGQRFAFKEPDTWPEPAELIEFEHPRWGQVRLRRWAKLHPKQDTKTVFDVILAEVHLERDKPPKPLWLGYLAGHTLYPVQEVWAWFDYRWPIEPSIRFRKQHLFWTLPRFQAADSCDRWTNLVDVAYWQLFLARNLVQDRPLPWQKAQTAFTPGRVLRGMGAIFSQIKTPAQPPQRRGKSPGWPRGRPRTRPPRFKPVKRGTISAQLT